MLLVSNLKFQSNISNQKSRFSKKNSITTTSGSGVDLVSFSANPMKPSFVSKSLTKVVKDFPDILGGIKFQPQKTSNEGVKLFVSEELPLDKVSNIVIALRNLRRDSSTQILKNADVKNMKKFFAELMENNKKFSFGISAKKNRLELQTYSPPSTIAGTHFMHAEHWNDIMDNSSSEVSKLLTSRQYGEGVNLLKHKGKTYRIRTTIAGCNNQIPVGIHAEEYKPNYIK